MSEEPSRLDEVTSTGFTWRERIRLMQLLARIRAGEYFWDRVNPTVSRLVFLRWLRQQGKLES